MVKYLLIVIHILIYVNCFAQSNLKVEPVIMKNKTTTYYRPLFGDSLNMFYNDTLIWKCHYQNTPLNSYMPLYIVDFQKIDTCRCFSEKYQKVREDIFSAESYKLMIRRQYGYFAKQKDNKFLYVEIDKEGHIANSVTYYFDFDKLVGSDTTLVVNQYTFDESWKVYNYFKVIKR